MSFLEEQKTSGNDVTLSADNTFRLTLVLVVLMFNHQTVLERVNGKN